MQKLRDRHINIDKTATMSIAINCVEVMLLVGLLVADLFDLNEAVMRVIRPFSTVALVVLIVEGITSVRDGFVWKKTNRQNEMLREAFDQLDDLNVQMRKQRHDFLNHLQVVYSLVDMGENAEATHYIENVYGQMHRLSLGMKTDVPAINALLQAKLGDAERRGMKMELDVTSRYANLPMNDWEMCRVLGNLIDNALDAMEGMPDGRVVVELYEDIRAYGFRVVNNGPQINPDVLPRIFNTGFTTKATGHGLGLSIVRELMEDCGGKIDVQSQPGRTAFVGMLPKGETKEKI
ncbi:MAG: sensor histidine kinase [Candidatus Spyradocola sp.]